MIYESLNTYLRSTPFDDMGKNIALAMLPFLAILLIFYSQHWYTLVNFSLAIILLTLLATINPHWSGRFFIFYLVHLIPFLLVNGILTGSFTPEPVVWYSDEAIMGPRIFTIPIEDLVYSLNLMLMNVGIFEFLRASSRKSKEVWTWS
jgi:lycopene cyclase domain-containing protein